MRKVEDSQIELARRTLLTRTAGGDSDAFAELYRLTEGAMVASVRSVIRQPDQVGDVLQEAYLQVWLQASRYDPVRGSVLAWMTTLASRRAIDMVRSVVAGVRREERHSLFEISGTSDLTWEDVDAAGERRQVRSGLMRLTPLQREAVVLAYFHHRTQVEVSALLNVPLGTVKSRIRDGMIRLRDDTDLAAFVRQPPAV